MLNNTLLIPAFIAIILVLGIAVALSFLKKKQTKNTILLLGTSHAGKTALYTLMRFNKRSPTVTSMKENQGSITLDNKTFDLVDMPGHERVRYQYADFLPVTRAVVYVVDSTSVSRNIRAVGEYLYDILAKPVTQRDRIPVLVACNKSDMITALPVEKIKSILETEFNRLRETRTAAVEQQASDADESEAFLGYEGESFKFDHLENNVQFESCSVEKKEIETINDWLMNV
ncbi:uncharacterized protein BYT42DRAFT_571637 [Radiomyces spectabilis]|uniref:uncharacterized protein n=1 Tax=Radiomyces spectabilis TaxID=64574 RepID=UPI00221E3E79|nr:uncharacterized protein BYT42DRAFT_571637 [Radiomyces spectabilis]KAI8377774.1 hypothetical protein BYT42DRAFT_571637 [Radiomyces spectabilis]